MGFEGRRGNTMCKSEFKACDWPVGLVGGIEFVCTFVKQVACLVDEIL